MKKILMVNFGDSEATMAFYGADGWHRAVATYYALLAYIEKRGGEWNVRLSTHGEWPKNFIWCTAKAPTVFIPKSGQTPEDRAEQLFLRLMKTLGISCTADSELALSGAAK